MRAVWKGFPHIIQCEFLRVAVTEFVAGILLEMTETITKLLLLLLNTLLKITKKKNSIL